MNNFGIESRDAWREIYNALTGEEPVDAVFSMVNVHGACMVVRVDGEALPIYLTLKRDGTWDAVYCPGGVPAHMEGKAK